MARVVLVDSTHPDHWTRVLAALGTLSPNESQGLKDWRELGQQSLKDLPDSRQQDQERFDQLGSGDRVRALGPLGKLFLVIITHSVAPVPTL